MGLNRETKCVGVTSSTELHRTLQLSDEPLADLLAEPGCEVLLQAGRARPQWVSGASIVKATQGSRLRTHLEGRLSATRMTISQCRPCARYGRPRQLRSTGTQYECAIINEVV